MHALLPLKSHGCSAGPDANFVQVLRSCDVRRTCCCCRCPESKPVGRKGARSFPQPRMMTEANGAVCPLHRKLTSGLGSPCLPDSHDLRHCWQT